MATTATALVACIEHFRPNSLFHFLITQVLNMAGEVGAGVGVAYK